VPSEKLIMNMSTTYYGWVAVGAISQATATGLLLSAMVERSFVVAVAFSKTELIQVAVLGTIFLNEKPSTLLLLAILIMLVGVSALANLGNMKSRSMITGAGIARGLACGVFFAMSSIAFRAAGTKMVSLYPESALFASVWSVLLAQIIQTAILGGWIAWTQPAALKNVFATGATPWLAGFAGAVASTGWFFAVILRPVAEVRTLGMLDMVFSYAVSRIWFHEPTTRRELFGISALVAGALVAVCSTL